MDPFRNGPRQNSRRIEEAEWEKYKGRILDLYKKGPVKKVKEVMEREHLFIASHRQLGHRLREVWGVRKYVKDRQNGQGTGQPIQRRQLRSTMPSPGEQNRRNDKLPRSHVASSAAPNVVGPAALSLSSAPPARPPSIHRPLPYLPQPDSTDPASRLRYRWLADMLLALGDAHHAFDIGAALWKVERTNGTQFSHNALVHIVSRVRAARTQEHAATCREMLNAVDVGVSDDEGSWRTTANDFLCALTYRYDEDPGACLGQIQDTIDDIVKADEESWRLEPLTGREGLRFDVPAYILLSSGLEWYNHPAILGKGEEEIDVQAVLQQFVDQQPALLEEPDTNFCLPLCLSWCIDELKNARKIPAIASLAQVPNANRTSEVYTVLCALWKTLLDSRFSPSSSSDTSPAWADEAESQLGIPATQLLCTVVCMMMAAVPQQNRAEDAGMSIAQKALAGANALETLDRRELIRRFLDQVRAANQPLMGPPDGEQPRLQNRTVDVDVSALNHFREFAAGSLGIQGLPPLEERAVVYPLVLVAP